MQINKQYILNPKVLLLIKNIIEIFYLFHKYIIYHSIFNFTYVLWCVSCRKKEKIREY